MLRLFSALLVMLSLASVPFAAGAQGKKDALVIGMTLEPPGLDPTAGAAAAIGEVTHYNVFEGLTQINADGSITPLLAESWTISPDQKTYTFKLRQGVKFHNGEPFNSAQVKYSFERAASETSTNKDKPVFTAMATIDTPDANTVAITLKQSNPDELFLLGQNTAVIVEPKSAATNNTRPVGTGPFKLENWVKGSTATLVKSEDFRAAAGIRLNKITFRFISDPAAQVAAMLSGDVDAFPRFNSGRSTEQFRGDGRFTVVAGGTKGKTIVAINNKRKPFDDVRVRRAVAAAIDRRAVIDGAVDGLGVPIGSHAVPGDVGYVDLTGVNPFNPEKAKALLKEAGVVTPLEVTLKLPPPGYARQGGEIIAAELAKVGINARIENVEWAQWLSGVYKSKNYDLTVISHVEPLDLVRYTDPEYYFQYDSPAFRDIMAKVAASGNGPERSKLLGDAHRQLANDSVNAYLFQFQQLTVAKKGVKGLWKDAPIFANDLSAVYWE